MKKAGQAEQERMVIRMYMEGASVEDIRVKAHIGVCRFYEALRNAGVPMRTRGARKQETDPEKLRQAVAMYEAGERIAVIKRSLHIAERSMYRALKDAGVPFRTPRKRKEAPRYESKRLKRTKRAKSTTTNIVMLQQSFGEDFVGLANKVLAGELMFRI